MHDEKSSLHDVQTALRKYNRTNSTTVHYCYIYLRLSLLFRNSYLEFGYYEIFLIVLFRSVFTFQFELDEITVKCLFFEFGDPGYQYNFTAKPDSHPSAGGNSNLFFAEINYPLQSEDDVLLCCIVGEKDAGMLHSLALLFFSWMFYMFFLDSCLVITFIP